MIPVLFKGNATNFNTNGVGALTETLECKVTEERNGAYELEMTVTTTTPNFSEIQTGALIVAKVSDGTRQAFEIDRISKPINQRVTIHANHIGYRASYVPVRPFIANGITETLQGLNDNALTTNPFTLYSDFTNETSTYNQSIPKSLRACLGGTEGSLLDTFAGGGAGEFLWDNYTINFLMHRGTDRGTQLRYKKNITEFEHVKETDDFITGVLPYWSNDDGTVVLYGDIQYSPDHTDYDSERVVILDLSDQWEETPTATMINSAGLEYITGTSNNKPSVNITLSFINNTGEEAIPEEIRLCDTVTVYYEPLDVTFKSKVVKTVWNVLKERYDEKDSRTTAIGDSHWQATADPSKWPTYEIYADSPWNYALHSNLSGMKVEFKAWPENNYPWSHEGTPITVKAKGSRVEGWGQDATGLCQVLPDADAPRGKTERITLIPMGAARLRISAFPPLR